MKKPKMTLERKIDVINELEWRMKCVASEFVDEENKDKQEFFERIMSRFYEAISKEIAK